MRRGKKLLSTVAFALTSGTVIYNLSKKYRKTKEEQSIDSQVENLSHKPGFYERYIKRPQDFCCALVAVVVLSPVMAVTSLLVRLKLGSPIIFKQERPGLNSKVFTLYKFRTMTDEKDTEGNLLSDEVRLTKFRKMLRATSLDELPELFNILKGDMSVGGPRPLLVRYLPLYNTHQARRHEVRPGFTGYA